jgi:hypothetical protein
LPYLPAGYAQAFHRFSLGSHHIEGTTLEFSFPDDKINVLYVFIFGEWNGLNEKTNQAIIRLYDLQKNLLDEGKNVCINTKHGKSFGSIAFSKINRTSVGKAAYFTLSAAPCMEGKNRLHLKDNPELQPLFEYVTLISKILLQCLQTGKSEQDCVCANKSAIAEPIRKADAFIKNRPELKGKELSLFESKSITPDKGSEKVSLSMPVDEITTLQSHLRKCK